MSINNLVRMLAEDSHDHDDDDHDSHDDESEDHSTSDAAIAFTIVLFAGLSTAVGASAVFFPRIVSLASPGVLAGALGFSAGVMLFLSLAEIFPVAINHFAVHNEHEDAFMYAVFSFFGGVIVMQISNFVVHKLNPPGHGHAHECSKGEFVQSCHEDLCREPAVTAPHCIACTDNPLGELSEWQNRAKEELEHPQKDNHTHEERDFKADNTTDNTLPTISDCCNNPSGCSKNTYACTLDNMDEEQGEAPSANDDDDDDVKDSKADTEEKDVSDVTSNHDSSGHSHAHSDHGHSHSHDHAHPSSRKFSIYDHNDPHEKKKVLNAGVSTALAIAIHNFPEGLATFIAGVEDPKIAGVLAIAIVIHNIPEGLCVALPIYYGTGNRLKGFLWGALSGFSEPLAAALTWAILYRTEFNENIYGVLFGLTTGMMVIISLKELLPAAHRYDPLDKVVTNSLIAGFVVMALSLVLLERSGQHDHGVDGHDGHE
jgi:ZIP family zinc transporter